MNNILTRFGIELETARFVVINGVPLPVTYARPPDDFMISGDIVLEAGNDGEVQLMQSDLDNAAELEPGLFKLETGAIIGFLSPVTIH